MVGKNDIPEEFYNRFPSLLILCIALLIAVSSLLVFFPKIKDEFIKKERSEVFEGQNLKSITLALDSYAGYTIAQSSLIRKKLRNQGINLSILNQPDFYKRVELFSENKVDLMCITVDAYLKNGVKFVKGDLLPGPIIAVISESRGADAVFVSKDSSIQTINDLNKENLKIALTPDSPSEFLAQILIENFGLNNLEKTKEWLTKTKGSEEAKQLLETGNVHAAIVWEPDVSQLSRNKEFTKLHDSGKNRRMILDVLVASPELVKEKNSLMIYLKNYFECVDEFSKNEQLFIKEIEKFTHQSKSIAAEMMQRIEWFDLYANAINLFGLRDIPNVEYDDISEFLVECIENVSDLLFKIGDLDKSKFNSIIQNPFNILNSVFINQLSENGVIKTINFKRKYSSISKGKFLSLPVIGSLKIDPIEFKSGMSQLSRSGYKTVDRIARILKTYEYRIIVEGHTEPGDSSIIMPLSQDRADAVKRVLIHTHGISGNRILSIGYGDKKPLIKGNMSRREWHRKLRRVEIVLVSDEQNGNIS